MKIRKRTREDELRENIPSIEDVPTLYRPSHSFLMIVPLPEQDRTEGGIFLTEKSRQRYYEGHVVAKGPRCSDQYNLGDCVTYPQSAEYLLEVEKVKFTLVMESEVLMFISRAALEQGHPSETFPEQPTLNSKFRE